jgi:hypothetical protein
MTNSQNLAVGDRVFWQPKGGRISFGTLVGPALTPDGNAIIGEDGGVLVNVKRERADFKRTPYGSRSRLEVVGAVETVELARLRPVGGRK